MIGTVWSWLIQIGALFEQGWNGLWASIGIVETSFDEQEETTGEKERLSPGEVALLAELARQDRNKCGF